MIVFRNFENWLYRRYFFNKFNLAYLDKKFSFFERIKLSISFVNSYKLYSREFLSVYIFFLDLNGYLPPVKLKSKIFYRGKSTSKVTSLCVHLQSQFFIQELLNEIFFFIIFRNLDFRKMLYFSSFIFFKFKSLQLFFNIRKFAYMSRDLKSFNLPNLVLSSNYKIKWLLEFDFYHFLIVKHFMFVYLSFLFLIFDDFNKDFNIY